MKQKLWAEEDKKTNDRLVAQIVELRSTIADRDTTIVQLKVDHTKSLNEAIRKFNEWQTQTTTVHFTQVSRLETELAALEKAKNAELADLEKDHEVDRARFETTVINLNGIFYGMKMQILGKNSLIISMRNTISTLQDIKNQRDTALA